MTAHDTALEMVTHFCSLTTSRTPLSKLKTPFALVMELRLCRGIRTPDTGRRGSRATSTGLADAMSERATAMSAALQNMVRSASRMRSGWLETLERELRLGSRAGVSLLLRSP